MAKTYRLGPFHGTVSLLPIPDFREPMSGIALFPFGLLSGPDVLGDPDLR